MIRVVEESDDKQNGLYRPEKSHHRFVSRRTNSAFSYFFISAVDQYVFL
jgi:hypothetical protein